jgi:hypothetical protein
MRTAGLPADESSAFVAEDGVYAVYVSTRHSTREEL